MSDSRYVGKQDIAKLFDSGWQAAAEQLAKAGVTPIDLGPGKGRGRRWFLPAVMDALTIIHEKAQPRSREHRPRTPKGFLGVAEMSVSDLQKLVANPNFTNSPIQ